MAAGTIGSTGPVGRPDTRALAVTAMVPSRPSIPLPAGLLATWLLYGDRVKMNSVSWHMQSAAGGETAAFC